MSVQDPDDNQTICTADHLPDGYYTCENTTHLPRVSVQVSADLTIRISQLECGRCVVWGGMVIRPRPGLTIGEQIAALMTAKIANEKARQAILESVRRNNNHHSD